ncbi:pilus assembly protein [Moritella yayanosii]|uniref:Putative type IV assembly protein n=1 Tax=Moritella yayanosii TaxID=69539 RepID=A0A330LSL6_9GAMM|nr:PilC/PilY family type IV pilus protein [Moritella yayanosii]SQD78961.1 putative type IV assembly protein [Moritella yayanosii]
MKRIFKPVSVILFAISSLSVIADESEIYQAELKNREPQVLIILDTSSHMKDKVDYPYPNRYDPHIAYPPVSDTLGEKLADNLFGDEFYYYSKAAAATNLEHDSLVTIAKEGLANPETALNPTYTSFVNTIPRLGSNDKFESVEMNCYSALEDLDGALGAFGNSYKRWLHYSSSLFTGIRYKWLELAEESDIFYNYVECAKDIDNSVIKNPGYEHNQIISRPEGDYQGTDVNGDDIYSGDGVNDNYAEDSNRQGYPVADAERILDLTNLGNGTLDSIWNAGYGSTPYPITGSEYKAYVYSENLVKWAELAKNGSVVDGNFMLSNLQIAKKVILDLMLDTTDIKTGLEVFNSNEGYKTWSKIANNHGGRILSGIQTYDTNSARVLKDKVGDILTTRMNRSALCESLYEGYLYLYGKQIKYGDKFSLLSRPNRDRSVEEGDRNNRKYINPLMEWSQTCQTEAYIIIVSPGYHDVTDSPFNFFDCVGPIDAHDHDDDANSDIMSLPNADVSKAVEMADIDCKKNYMPVLSHWLATNDMNPSTPDVTERIITYTVGIGTVDESGNTRIPAANENLLDKTAKGGGGKYYRASDANALKTQLLNAFADIRARQNSTASNVGTSIDSSYATQNSDNVYYSMFEANVTSRWMGNLKKFKVTDAGVLSAWSEPATSTAAPVFKAALASTASGASSTTYFKNSVYSGWSTSNKTNSIKSGGVVEAYSLRSPVSGASATFNPRKIYFNNDDLTEPLVDLNIANLKEAYGLSADEDRELAIKLGIEVDVNDSDDEIRQHVAENINWLLGIDATGQEYRKDIFGDPMHSSPLVIQFGTSTNPAYPQIFIGTNAGFFHAFEDKGRTVEEKWAFIPINKLKYALSLRASGVLAAGVQREYGVDGSAVDIEYFDSTQAKHLVTFGMRRGGSAYYTLDLGKGTEPPSLKWSVDSTTPGFTELGQTWSKPVVTKVFQSSNESDNSKPVLIFSGGYDPRKDTCTTDDCSGKDTKGRAIYVVDALTGDIVESFTSADSNPSNHSFKDSIASQVAVLDSDGDGYTDRIYVGDTGGNIYRIDMPAILNTLGTSVDKTKWRVRKLANLGGDGKDDRRFFNAPSIVRARDGLNLYDGILLGSGDITRPNSDKSVQNYFYNIKDSDIYPIVWGDKVGEKPLISPIGGDDLAKISYSTPVLDPNNEDITPLSIPIDSENNINGWQFKLNEDDAADGILGGEKSLGNAVVINGVVHFNTYTPFTSDYIVTAEQCVFNQSGNSHYYQVNMNTGKIKFYRRLSNVIAKDLTVHARIYDGKSVLRILGAGKGDTTDIGGVPTPTGTIDTEVTLSPRPIYRYFNEAAL